jgi:hypothetical protein
MLEADYNDASFPLELTVNNAGVGGVTGLTCTVAVRQAGTTSSYLDWATNTFKTSSWTTKNQPMTDLGTGCYQTALPVSLLGYTLGSEAKLVAEYTSSGVGAGGFAADTICVSPLRPNAQLARQYQTNKAVALGATVGTLTVYADDGVTALKVHTLADFAAGQVSNVAGTPAQRGSA